MPTEPHDETTIALASSLAEGLRTKRLKLGLSVRQVAAKAGLDSSVVSKFEAGKVTNAKLATIVKIATACGVKIELRIAPMVSDVPGE